MERAPIDGGLVELVVDLKAEVERIGEIPRHLHVGIIDWDLHRFAGLENSGHAAAGKDLDGVGIARGQGRCPVAGNLERRVQGQQRLVDDTAAGL